MTRRKKTLVMLSIWLGWIVLSLPLNAQLRFEKAVVDLGEFLQNEKRQQSVAILNSSDRPQRLGQLVVDCACLKVGELPAKIEAGASLKLELSIESGGLSGVQRKNIRLGFGPQGKKTIKVEIRFKVIAELELQPTRVMLGPIATGTKVERLCVLTARAGQKPEICLASPIPNVDVKIESLKVTSDRKKRWQIRLTVAIAKNETPGRFQRVVLLKVTGARVEDFRISIFGDIEADLFVRPRVADFGRVKVNEEGVLKVKIASRRGQVFRLKKAIDDGAVFVDFDDKVQASSLTVTLQLPQGQTLGQKFGYIRLITDHPEVAVVELRYRARIVKENP